MGIISIHFPVIGEVPIPADCQPLSIDYASSSRVMVSLDCDCPRPPPLPTTLPCPATEENTPKLKEYLIDYYSFSTFNTYEHQPLLMMEAPLMHLMIDPKAKPTAYHSPIPVPIHWQDDVKVDMLDWGFWSLYLLVSLLPGVTGWLIAPRRMGSPGGPLIFSHSTAMLLKKLIIPSLLFIKARSVPHGKMKTAFDAWNGYHSVPLHPDDHHYTTFITPWGRHRYCTAPQGYIASGDDYSRHYDEVVSSFPQKTKCVNNTLLWSDTIHFRQPGDWTFVDDMALLSIQISLCLFRIMWSLLDLRLQVTLFTLVRDILELSQNFLSLRT